MQTVQRTLLVIAILLIFMKGWHLVCEEQEEKIQKQWEYVQTDFFLQSISRKGTLALEEYEKYHLALNKLEANITVRMEEYRKEKDKEGNCYFYLITWEELQDSMLCNDNAAFSQDSIIMLELIQSKHRRSSSRKYYIRVSGQGVECG